jgi:hypothetical protein
MNTIAMIADIAPLAIGEIELEDYLQVKLTQKEFEFFELGTVICG